MTFLRNYREMPKLSGKCFYCGRMVHRNQAQPQDRPTWDHKVPLSRGGIDLPANLVVSCPVCNTDKGSLTLPEYRAFWIIIKNFRNLSMNNHIRITDIRFAGEVRA